MKFFYIIFLCTSISLLPSGVLSREARILELQEGLGYSKLCLDLLVRNLLIKDRKPFSCVCCLEYPNRGCCHNVLYTIKNEVRRLTNLLEGLRLELGYEADSDESVEN